ncbi:MAG: MFS transporter, partial [Ignavibacterium sp.]|nr:MFS transporter [Ignavibacterium sp.]
ALFQGFAFLPIAIAWTLGGTFGGWLYHSYGRKEVGQPEMVFLIIGLVGVVAAIMMFVYNAYMKRAK